MLAPGFAPKSFCNKDCWRRNTSGTSFPCLEYLTVVYNCYFHKRLEQSLVAYYQRPYSTWACQWSIQKGVSGAGYPLIRRENVDKRSMQEQEHVRTDGLSSKRIVVSERQWSGKGYWRD